MSYDATTPARARLTVRFTSFWLSGTGATRGRHTDVVTYRDGDGCPAMPPTQVKGQLRESAARLAKGCVSGWTPELITTLFGSAPDHDRERIHDVKDFHSDQSIPGLLAFRGDARLEATELATFRPKERTAWRAQLFRRIASTRIDVNGTAEDRTLRSVEAVVPLTLVAEIECLDPGQCQDWVRLLDAAAGVTLAFGKMKADGYGRAIAKVTDLSKGTA